MTTKDEADESAGSWIHSHSITPGPLEFANMVIKKQASEIERLKAERDAAFKMSKCECASDEACANQVRKDALLREALAAQSKYMIGVSILNDGPDKSDEDHAHALLVESMHMARASIANIKTELGK